MSQNGYSCFGSDPNSLILYISSKQCNQKNRFHNNMYSILKSLTWLNMGKQPKVDLFTIKPQASVNDIHFILARSNRQSV